MPCVATISYRMFIDDPSHNRAEYISDIHDLVYWVVSRMPAHVQSYKVVCGEHLTGESNRAHFHLAIQCPLWRKPANESRDRIVWKIKDGDPPWCTEGQNLTLTYKPAETCETNLRDHLSYPLKEGMNVPLLFPSSMKHIELLKGEDLSNLLKRGQMIFEAEAKSIKRKARVRKKTLTILQTCMAISVGIPKGDYNTWKHEMYKRFHHDLKLEEYPCFNDLKNAIHKVAIFDKIVSASYFDNS